MTINATPSDWVKLLILKLYARHNESGLKFSLDSDDKINEVRSFYEANKTDYLVDCISEFYTNGDDCESKDLPHSRRMECVRRAMPISDAMAVSWVQWEYEDRDCDFFDEDWPDGDDVCFIPYKEVLVPKRVYGD